MNWRPRSSTVSGATRGALATETEAMELVNDAGDVVASFSEDVTGNFSHDLPQPNGVKVYRALLTQSGTDAPVATVLENTLGGTVVWTRDSAGIYVATLTGAFTADKTIAPGRVWFTSSTDVITCAGVRTSANAITYTVNKWHWEDLATNVMEVQDISELGLPATVLLDVEILVYP